MAEERLQKVMAAAGVASRRACEELISDGRVQVDGRVITIPGTKVEAGSVTISVDGRPIRPSLLQNNVYYKVYKPRGILSDIGGDSRGRRTVAQLLPPEVGRVYPVGRLDLNSEGLILLTDDGALTHRLTHPRFEHPKTYYVLVSRQPSTDTLIKLREGVELEDGRTAPARVEVAERLPARLVLDRGSRTHDSATGGRRNAQPGGRSAVPAGRLPEERGVWLRIVLREGKKRQIRHMAAAVEIHLVRLIRWSIGPLTLEGLQPGMSRELTAGELNSLRDMVDGRRGGSSTKGRPKSRPDRRRARRPRTPRNR